MVWKIDSNFATCVGLDLSWSPFRIIRVQHAHAWGKKSIEVDH